MKIHEEALRAILSRLESDLNDWERKNGIEVDLLVFRREGLLGQRLRPIVSITSELSMRIKS